MVVRVIKEEVVNSSNSLLEKEVTFLNTSLRRLRDTPAAIREANRQTKIDAIPPASDNASIFIPAITMYVVCMLDLFCPSS